MLEEIFNMDNPFFRGVNRIADMVIVNVLFLISCIPIVTIGPALTALYYVSINTWSRDDGYIFRMYVKSFKENIKQSIILWLILLVVGTVLSVDVWFWVSQWKLTANAFCKPMIVISVILLVVYALIFTYVWPLQAKFSNKISGTIKNALAMAITHVPETFGIWLILGVVAFAVYMVNIARVCVVVIGFSLVAYLQALIFRHVFKPYLQKEEKKTPEEEAALVGYDNTYADAKLQVAELTAKMEAKNAAKEAKKAAAEQKEEQIEEQEEQQEAPKKPTSIKDIIAATSNSETE